MLEPRDDRRQRRHANRGCPNDGTRSTRPRSGAPGLRPAHGPDLLPGADPGLAARPRAPPMVGHDRLGRRPAGAFDADREERLPRPGHPGRHAGRGRAAGDDGGSHRRPDHRPGPVGRALRRGGQPAAWADGLWRPARRLLRVHGDAARPVGAPGLPGSGPRPLRHRPGRRAGGAGRRVAARGPDHGRRSERPHPAPDDPGAAATGPTAGGTGEAVGGRAGRPAERGGRHRGDPRVPRRGLGASPTFRTLAARHPRRPGRRAAVAGASGCLARRWPRPGRSPERGGPPSRRLDVDRGRPRGSGVRRRPGRRHAGPCGGPRANRRGAPAARPLPRHRQHPEGRREAPGAAPSRLGPCPPCLGPHDRGAAAHRLGLGGHGLGAGGLCAARELGDAHPVLHLRQSRLAHAPHPGLAGSGRRCCAAGGSGRWPPRSGSSWRC